MEKILNILITAPSLNTKNNVSGVSSVVNNILETTELNYIHFEVGKQDKEKRDLKWILKQFYLPINLFIVFFSNKVDLFHLNAPLNKLSVIRDFLLLIVAKIFRKKTILHFHGGEFLIKVPKSKMLFNFLKFYFKLGDKIITLSQYEKELVNKNYNIPLEKIVPLENCVIPLENIKKEKKEKARVIFLGRIVESKGINEIIISMKKLYDYRKDFEFFLYGTGPLENKIIDELNTYMPDSFKFKGIISGKEKDEAMIKSDIFILPSLHGEGLPIALLEAMNTENICIVTNDGSMATVIIDNKNGFIVKKGDSEDLFNKLNTSIDLILTENKTISKKAKDTILEKYNSSIYSKKLKEIYTELIS